MMRLEKINKLVVVILSGVLLLYIATSSINSINFNPKDLLYSYTILLYDIISSIYFLLNSE